MSRNKTYNDNGNGNGNDTINFNTLSTIFTKPNYTFYPENEEDTHCKYINIRGLLKSCDIHSLTPVSSIHDLIGYEFEFKSDTNPMIYTIYICNSAISKFANKLKNEKAFKKLNCKFIVVSGDSDDTCPDDLFSMDNDSVTIHTKFMEFIENDKIIHWFSQNCILPKNTHKKLSQIPIGLAYHHLHNEDIEHEAKKIVSPMKQDRYEAITKIPKNLIFSEKDEVSRTISWNTQANYAFVVSPFGNGYDCHRTWEALILGCIPIVKTSGIDNLYDDLPVLIVQDWADITEKLLSSVITVFKKKHEKGEFNYDKLRLEYWMDKINSHKI